MKITQINVDIEIDPAAVNPFFLVFDLDGDKGVINRVFEVLKKKGLKLTHRIPFLFGLEYLIGLSGWALKNVGPNSESYDIYDLEKLVNKVEQISFQSLEKAEKSKNQIQALLDELVDTEYMEYCRLIKLQENTWIYKREELYNLFKSNMKIFNLEDIKGAFKKSEDEQLNNLALELMYFSYETLRTISNQMITQHDKGKFSDMYLYYKLILEIGDDFHNLPLSMQEPKHKEFYISHDYIAEALVNIIVVNQLLKKDSISAIISKTAIGYIPSLDKILSES